MWEETMDLRSEHIDIVIYVALKEEFDDVKKDLSEVLYQQNMKKAYDVWIAELRAKASIKINQIW